MEARWEFFHSIISPDEAVLEQRVYQIQQSPYTWLEGLVTDLSNLQQSIGRGGVPLAEIERIERTVSDGIWIFGWMLGILDHNFSRDGMSRFSKKGKMTLIHLKQWSVLNTRPSIKKFLRFWKKIQVPLRSIPTSTILWSSTVIEQNRGISWLIRREIASRVFGFTPFLKRCRYQNLRNT